MSSLCYNINVIYMKNEYNYYLKVIKPLEKKYNRVSFLYSLFKFKYLKNKRSMYNRLLTIYYKMLYDNTNYSKKLAKQLKNSQK